MTSLGVSDEKIFVDTGEFTHWFSFLCCKFVSCSRNFIYFNCHPVFFFLFFLAAAVDTTLSQPLVSVAE